MDNLFEIKTRIVTFVEKYETYVKPASRFVLMLTAYLMVYFNISYYSKINVIFIPIILSVACALLPLSLGSVVLGLYTAANLYGLGIEIAGVFLALLILTYLLYFRFTRDKGMLLVLSPVANFIGVPYALPVITGLQYQPASSVGVLMGTVIFGFLKGIKANADLLLASEDLKTTKLHIAVEQIIANKEMWLILGAFFFTSVIVYFIRRLAIKNSWRIAIVSGIVVQLLIILIGKLLLGNPYGIVGLMIGSIVSGLICLIFRFFAFDLDYQRIEHVQFEDENYYYYVKAVPKVLIPVKDVKVKTFNETKVKREEGIEEEIAKEFDIDPKHLKNNKDINE
ncbi:MAG: hypothetical protein IJM91_05225 [Lachnospiraceae bacterium]|nr:hypothetical protein [Lachnospiraceae bacterium]